MSAVIEIEFFVEFDYFKLKEFDRIFKEFDAQIV